MLDTEIVGPTENRRECLRFPLWQVTNLTLGYEKSIFVLLEDISLAGARIRSDAPLQVADNYVLKFKVFGSELFFGLKLKWKGKEECGSASYGGKFVGFGSQVAPEFRDFIEGLS